MKKKLPLSTKDRRRYRLRQPGRAALPVRGGSDAPAWGRERDFLLLLLLRGGEGKRAPRKKKKKGLTLFVFFLFVSLSFTPTTTTTKIRSRSSCAPQAAFC